MEVNNDLRRKKNYTKRKLQLQRKKKIKKQNSRVHMRLFGEYKIMKLTLQRVI